MAPAGMEPRTQLLLPGNWPTATESSNKPAQPSNAACWPQQTWTPTLESAAPNTQHLQLFAIKNYGKTDLLRSAQASCKMWERLTEEAQYDSSPVEWQAAVWVEWRGSSVALPSLLFAQKQSLCQICTGVHTHTHKHRKQKAIIGTPWQLEVLATLQQHKTWSILLPYQHAAWPPSPSSQPTCLSILPSFCLSVSPFFLCPRPLCWPKTFKTTLRCAWQNLTRLEDWKVHLPLPSN